METLCHFQCRRCGNCCRWPGYVRVSDAEIDAIAAFLHQDVSTFIATETRLTRDRSGLSLRENSDGGCPYLIRDEAGLPACRIEPVKPAQCRNFPQFWNFPGWEKECEGAQFMQEQSPVRQLGTMLVLSGPSGVGKSSVVSKVRNFLPNLRFSVSCTTRKPRPGETHGVHYYFLSEEDFSAKISRGEFLEHAAIFQHRYGTLKSEVLRFIEQGETVLLDIDVQGARQIRHAIADDETLRRCSEFVFLAPPSLAVLEERLRGRNTESEEQITLRLNQAGAEMANWRLYDYLLINDELELCAQSLYGILSAASCRATKYTGDFSR